MKINWRGAITAWFMVSTSLMVSHSAFAADCPSKDFTTQATLIFVDHMTAEHPAGTLLKHRVSQLKAIMSHPAFEGTSTIKATLSRYRADAEEERENLVITLQARFSGGYDAVTLLFQEKEHDSLDITQCL